MTDASESSTMDGLSLWLPGSSLSWLITVVMMAQAIGLGMLAAMDSIEKHKQKIAHAS